MKTVNKDYLVELANKMLFENTNTAKINLPVDGGMYKTNSRMSMYDRPGPNISGEQEYHSVEDDIDLPLTASELVNNQSLIQIDFDPHDKEFVPDNKTELASALTACLDKVGNNDLSKKEIQKVWKSFTEILEKVK